MAVTIGGNVRITTTSTGSLGWSDITEPVSDMNLVPLSGAYRGTTATLNKPSTEEISFLNFKTATSPDGEDTTQFTISDSLIVRGRRAGPTVSLTTVPWSTIAYPFDAKNNWFPANTFPTTIDTVTNASSTLSAGGQNNLTGSAYSTLISEYGSSIITTNFGNITGSQSSSITASQSSIILGSTGIQLSDSDFSSAIGSNTATIETGSDYCLVDSSHFSHLTNSTHCHITSSNSGTIVDSTYSTISNCPSNCTITNCDNSSLSSGVSLALTNANFSSISNSAVCSNTGFSFTTILNSVNVMPRASNTVVLGNGSSQSSDNIKIELNALNGNIYSVGAIDSASVNSNIVNLTGIDSKITGDFTTTEATYFQTRIANNVTVVSTRPTGTSKVSGFSAGSESSSPDNSSLKMLVRGGVQTAIESSRSGTGPYLPLIISTSGSVSATFGINGNTGFGVTAPDTTARIQSANGIKLGNTANPTSVVLDWYEEGTFTPTLVGSGTAGTATYGIRSGRYTRVGNEVSIHIDLVWSDFTGTGSIHISGLPFTSRVSETSPLSFFYDNITLGAGYTLQGYVTANSTNASLQKVLDTGGGGFIDFNSPSAGYFSVACRYEV